MPEKASAGRNNVGTVSIGGAVVDKDIGTTAYDIMADMPDGTVGIEFLCASADVYLHGTASSAPTTKIKIAGSGVLAQWRPFARAANCWISTSANSHTVNVLPTIGFVEG